VTGRAILVKRFPYRAGYVNEVEIESAMLCKWIAWLLRVSKEMRSSPVEEANNSEEEECHTKREVAPA